MVIYKTKNYLLFNYLFVYIILNSVILLTLGRTSILNSVDDKNVSNQVDDKVRKSTEGDDDIVSNLRIKIYKGLTIEEATIIDIPMNKSNELLQYIDPWKPLVVYIHGFREHPSNESVQTIVKAYLERGADNILIIDWSKLAYDIYLKVVQNSKKIAAKLTEMIDGIIDLGFDSEKIHLVGHSLGGQIAGFTGRYSNYSLPRITGLDPAGPGFYGIGREHIDADCARFVDIIHTDGGFYGALPNTGTVDFFANKGTRFQPGCSRIPALPLSPIDLCSHWRSWRIYAESVENIDAFTAVKCSTYKEFMGGKCRLNHVTRVGYQADDTVNGTYYFATSDNFPSVKEFLAAENTTESLIVLNEQQSIV